MSTASERLEDLKQHKKLLQEEFKKLRDRAGEEVAFDNVRLDDESMRTSKLHNKWLSELAEAAYQYQSMKNTQKRLELERWKYWMGKQTDKYYAEYGVPHEKTLKTDLDKYLNADDYLIEMNEIMELQSQTISFLEKTVKDISNRGFAIGNAIAWRKFESGVN